MIKLKNYVVTIFFFFLPFAVKATDVLTLIQESNIQYKGIASKIAVLETGNFKSKQFKNHNNAFGFKRNSRKLYVRTQNGYCVYSSVEHSIQDYMLWERKMIKSHKLHSRSSFLSFLNRVYSKSRKYSTKLESVKIKVEKIDTVKYESVEKFLSLQYPFNNEVVTETTGILPSTEFIDKQLTKTY